MKKLKKEKKNVISEFPKNYSPEKPIATVEYSDGENWYTLATENYVDDQTDGVVYFENKNFREVKNLGYPLNTYSAATKDYVDRAINQALLAYQQSLLQTGPFVPTGTILAHAKPSGTLTTPMPPPPGYIWCDGSSYDGSKPLYAALYRTIGTAWGSADVSNAIRKPIAGNTYSTPSGLYTFTTSAPHGLVAGQAICLYSTNGQQIQQIYVNSVTSTTIFTVQSWIQFTGGILSYTAPTVSSYKIFNVPDLRGLFLRGTNTINGISNIAYPGNDPDASSRGTAYMGGNAGDKTGSYQDNAIKNHTHGLTDPGHGHTFSVPIFNTSVTSNAAIAAAYTQAGQTNTLRFITDPTYTGITLNGPGGYGTNVPVYMSTYETRPSNAGVNYIIKL